MESASKGLPRVTSDGSRLALRVSDLQVSYGAIRALRDFTLDVPAGKITSLIGLNGAGKSTALKAVMGLVAVQRGSITAGDGTDVLRVRAHERAVRFGLAYVPEGRGLFARMSVGDNLRFGQDIGARRVEAVGRASSLDDVLVAFPQLKGRLGELAGNLSGGEQQMVAIARALLANGDVLLLDEPSIGLAPIVQESIFRQLVGFVRDRQLTVLLVEQKTDFALTVSDFAHVLEKGALRLSGTAAEVASHPEVTEIYFGRKR